MTTEVAQAQSHPGPSGPSTGPRQHPVVRFLRSPRTARALFPIVVIAAWVAVSASIESLVFPEPLRVLDFMWNEIRLETLARTSLYENLAISLARLFIGFGIAMVIGTVIGLAMGLSKSVDAFFHDWVMAILAMPALVWALFLGLVFGFGHLGPVLATLLAGIPFIIINVREGVRNTPKELFDMARSFGVPRNRMTRHLLIPSLMPFMFAAMRYGFSVGWKGLVLAEVFASDQGMGWMIKYWYDAHRAYAVVGYGLFFVAFALMLEYFVFDRLYKRSFRWRPQLGAVDIVEEGFRFDDTLEGADEDPRSVEESERGT
jgi:NitT/TauT family transport system permease protein